MDCLKGKNYRKTHENHGKTPYLYNGKMDGFW
jgi:hypothetical protein